MAHWRMTRRTEDSDRRETASEEAATSPAAVAGQVVDLRGNGTTSVVEVRVPREDAGQFYTGQEVLLDTRPVWYVEGDQVGSTKLHCRLRPHDAYVALFVDDLPTAQRIADLLNEHGGPIDERG